ncbi:cyclic nucleotide-binding domain-containing protein [bacterium]|nr:cyclic nucleotide-binding domain-containing protein [bacterium]
MATEQQIMDSKQVQAKPRIRSFEWLPFRKRRSTREQRIHSVLSETPLFQSIGRRDWTLLSNLFHDRKYEHGEAIFEKGMPGLGMYVILDGEVDIIGNDDDDSPTLAHLLPGDFFGEMAVIQEGVRNATAVAATDCELIGIFRPQLRELLHDRPRLGTLLYERLARVLADRLRRADEMLLELTHQLDGGDDA